MKDLTIVVPLYNKVHYIESTLNSIYECTTNLDWECIVVDDGSTDGSTEVAKNWCNSHPDRYTYVQCLRNHGPYPSYARNMGLRMAESEYVMFFDADDLMCPGYPERGVKFMRENPDYWLYSEAFYVVDKEENYGDWFEFFEFIPYVGKNDIDYPGFVKVGGGAYTRGIFKTSEAKKFRYKDVLLEDTVFILDYLYPCKRWKLNLNNFGFYYFVCRTEQDKMALTKLKDENEMTDRQYIYQYVKDTYPEYYTNFIENNGNYKVELKETKEEEIINN